MSAVSTNETPREILAHEFSERFAKGVTAHLTKAFSEFLDGTIQNEFSEPFVKGMQARMLQSFFKYGPVAKSVDKIDNIKCLKERLDKYAADGNTEWLMDAANFAMMEFMFPHHENAHFRSTSSDESPGRVRVDGERKNAPNE